MAAVIGRDHELRVDRDVPGRRGGGRTGACSSPARPGIGKTTVWREAVRRAAERGFRVLSRLRQPGRDAARSRDNRGPARPICGRGSARRCRSRRRARCPWPSSAPRRKERRSIRRPSPSRSTGSLRAIARVAPVLVAVDDVQWLDDPSAAALAFALRRLEEDDVRFVLAERAHGESRLPLGLDRYPAERLVRAEIGPLSVGAIAALVTERLGTSFSRPTMLAAPPDRERQRRSTRSSSRGRCSLAGGRVEPGEPLPVPRSLDELLAARAWPRCRSATRAALLPVAALHDPTIELVAETLDVTDLHARLRPAIAAHVVELDHGRIRFDHPLLAAAIYGRADGEARREVHRALAGTAPTLEERARNLALASDAPVAGVARVLDEAAQAALARGSPTSAAELYEAAARLTPEAAIEGRVRRVLAAAAALFDAGDATRAGGEHRSASRRDCDR